MNSCFNILLWIKTKDFLSTALADLEGGGSCLPPFFLIKIIKKKMSSTTAWVNQFLLFNNLIICQV